MWDWNRAASAIGVQSDGRFNAGAIELKQDRAVIWRRTDGTTIVLSGADVMRQAHALAGALARVGVGPGDRVAGLMGRRPEAFTTALAVWRLGAIYVPLFSGFGRDAAAVRLADSGTSVLVVDAANAEAAVAARVGISGLTIASVDGGPHADCDLRSLSDDTGPAPAVHETKLGDPATIMYTSGTSGTPKGCVIAHSGIVGLLPFVQHCLGLDPEEVLFSTADTGWSFGLYTTGLAPLALGATRLLYEGGFDPASWWAVAREYEATHLAGAPTGYRQLALAGPPGAVPIRAATSAGEPLTAEVVHWFQEQLDLTIHDAYGLTEVGMIAANLRGPTAGEAVPGSMGLPVPGFELRLCDADDCPVADGDPGRVAVRDNGWLLSSDYWGRSAEWQARLRDGWWYTEDLARRDANGRYWYVGRADDVIVTAGFNVGPTDVESALLEHPAIVDAGCVGEADDRKGQVVAAHVVLGEQAGSDHQALLEELRGWVGERVGWHAAPRRLHLHPALPRTESGKLRRRDLRQTLDSDQETLSA